METSPCLCPWSQNQTFFFVVDFARFSLSSLPVFDIHLSTQSRRRVRVFSLLSCYCHSLPCVLVTTFIRYLARRKVLSHTRLLRKHLTAYA